MLAWFGYLHLWLNFTHSFQSKGSFDIKSNMLVNIRKHFFTGCVIFLAWLAPRGCCVSPLGHGPGQFALGGPVWAGCRTTWPPEVPANLNLSVMLWSGSVLHLEGSSSIVGSILLPQLHPSASLILMWSQQILPASWMCHKYREVKQLMGEGVTIFKALVLYQ